MAGRFITTNQRTEITNNLIQTTKDILNNPYYLFNDKKPSISTYYNLNTTMTTLDESTRGNYAELSPDSPLRFNKINGFYLYGIDRIQPTLEIDEYGLENSDVAGDAFVLPKTIIPYPGDLFTLNQIDRPFVFRVTAVNPNQLDTGAIMYQINYTLASTDGFEQIDPQVVKVYNFSAENIGSNFGCLIEEELYSDIEEYENYLALLKDYYINLFYDNKIQSFSYLRIPNYVPLSGNCGHLDHLGLMVYDPYLIEFMIRNNTLKGASQYICIQQQMYLPNSFAIDYSTTFFSSLEEKDINKHYGKTATNLWLCTQRLSLLYAYPQDYYYTDYSKINPKMTIVDIFGDPDFANKIKTNTKTDNILKDMIIMYFNDEPYTLDTIHKLKHIDYLNNSDMYYMIPMVIFCLEQFITNELSNQAVTTADSTTVATT